MEPGCGDNRYQVCVQLIMKVSNVNAAFSVSNACDKSLSSNNYKIKSQVFTSLHINFLSQACWVLGLSQLRLVSGLFKLSLPV